MNKFNFKIAIIGLSSLVGAGLPAGADENENSAPVISGEPSASVIVNSAYEFFPLVDDPDGDALAFDIVNKPVWANFDPLTGELSGIPSPGHIGVTDQIVISVTDGMSTASLPPFTITVHAIGDISARLSWDIPITNVDGTPLIDLAGFKIYRGKRPGKYSAPETVYNPGLSSMVIDGLRSDNRYYFAVTAIDTSGNESFFSDEACLDASNGAATRPAGTALSQTSADVAGLPDISGDGVPDVAHLTPGDQPTVRFYSGASREKIKGVRYLGSSWSAVAMATIADGDANGMADDPAVAVLAHKASNGKHAVEVRRSDNGAWINKLFFLSPRWKVIDVAVVDISGSTSGSTVPALAVLAFNPDMPFCQQIKVQVRLLSDGTLVANRFFLNDYWTPLALEAVSRKGSSPILAVLARKEKTGSTVVQARWLVNGTLQRNTFFFNPGWVARDLAILPDSNGDGKAYDAAYVVLASHPQTGRNKAEVRRASDGARLKRMSMVGAKWEVQRLAVSDDIGGDMREEIGVLAKNPTDEMVAIQFKDYGDSRTAITIFP